ncbi:hypothetical protein LTR49_027518 [Elasticomyces elasticus]|nr:hypothetical protein LTR49_027518 [Elasticomyces elasticus]
MRNGSTESSFHPIYHEKRSWRLQTDVERVQQGQAEHAERIARLERRRDEDTRAKSVWSASSPFPSVLSGIPQQAHQRSPSDQFRGFDDEATTLMSSLHLDAENEPWRAMGANSRANSVRFDESANQNHFSHSSRASMDFMSRTSSGLSGLQMTERKSPHKSDGRTSSAHSMHSAASGRANSLNLKTGHSLGDSNGSSLDTPGLAPGLLLLGCAPAIIHCWMNTNFKHDALLYAAVCTGSFKSYLDLRLIHKLGFHDSITDDEAGIRSVRIPVYFPEAVPYPNPSRSSSPVPQLPTLTVSFQVVDRSTEEDSKAIQIFLGSNVLSAHDADILFSSSSMTLFDDERSKLSIPLVRPEDEIAFKTLYVSTGSPRATQEAVKVADTVKELLYLNGLGQGSSAASISSAAASPPPSGKYRPPGAIAAGSGAADAARAGPAASDTDVRPPSRPSIASRPSLTMIDTRSGAEEQPTDLGPQNAPLQPGTCPSTRGSWRRDGAATSSATSATTHQSNSLEWANAGRMRDASYQRKESGIKVFKPKTANRTFSATSASSAAPAASRSPGDGKSRFLDDGRRCSVTDNKTVVEDAKKENLMSSATSGAETATALKTKANPIGDGSAFFWVNPGGGARS